MPTHIKTKTCRECCQPKPLARFLPSRTSLDGCVARCLECVLAESQRNREARERRRALVQPMTKTRRQAMRAHGAHPATQ